jgi:hypothetical protein
MADRIYINDVGTIIEIDVQDTISSATAIAMKTKKFDGTEVSWDATAHGTTKIRYTVKAGDLNVSGIYYIQPYIAMPNWIGRGKTVKMVVYEKYE